MALSYPEIDPILFQLGPVAIRWYGLSYAFGIILGMMTAKWLVRKHDTIPITERQFEDFTLWAVMGVVLGGRLGFVVFYHPIYFLENPLEALSIWNGGMSFHGGLVGVLVAMALYSRSQGFAFLALADVVACVVPIGLGLGRIANFINAELWGRVTDYPWGMVFPNAGMLPRHPSQLYEAMLEGVVLLIILQWLARCSERWQPSGQLGGVFLMGYGLFRIIGEFFREPDAHIGLLAGGVTWGQILSLPMVVSGLFLFMWSVRRK
ncbi:MAG: prolipoprotein diacylglyceryl transferase [Magnetococcales bacterium]|nr:prolipoprotein diacylglyceryl transferase [Magnetococcales bacterium]